MFVTYIWVVAKTNVKSSSNTELFHIIQNIRLISKENIIRIVHWNVVESAEGEANSTKLLTYFLLLLKQKPHKIE